MPYLDKEKEKAAKHASYLRNKAKVQHNNQVARQKLKAWFKTIMDPLSCVSCGEDANECLDLHHLDATTKDDDVSALLAAKRSKERITNEIEKCVVLCANCHRKHHAGTLPLEIVPSMLTIVSKTDG